MRGHPHEAGQAARPAAGAILARRAAAGLLAAALGAGGCEPDPAPPEPEPLPVRLAAVEAWVWVAELGDDVFGGDRPADAVCDETLGIGLEYFGPDQALEINTDLCNYATVRQPSLVPLAVGDTVSLRIWHYELTAPMPSEGYLALAIDGEVLWEELVPIPSEGAFVERDFTVARELPAGVELQFHVHNHGANAYDLLGVQATPTGGAGAG